MVHYGDDVHGRQLSLGAILSTDASVEEVIAASRARIAAKEQLEKQLEHSTVKKTNRHQKRHQGRQGQKRRQYQVEEIIEVVDYDGDTTNMKKCGMRVSVVYDYQPGKIIKKVTQYLKYIDADNKIHKAPVPPRIIEKGRVSNRLVAMMHVEKYVYHMPYCRLIKKLQRLGAHFAASTVNDWEEICYRKLKRLLKLLKKIIAEHDYAQIDEVPIKYVNDVGKGKCSNAYFYVINVPRKNLVYFEFNPSRAAEVSKELLQDFKGKLQSDGLSSYKSAFKDNDEVTLLTCLAHIRRGFFKAKNNNKALAQHFLNETRVMYDIEAYCDNKNISDEERTRIRQQYIKPILDDMQQWLTNNRSALIADSPIARAFTYAINHWELMYEYVNDGKILPDNNGVERAIRPVTQYRRNSLFAGNEHGAERAALFFSLLETCKLNNIDPMEYLCDVYDRIYDCTAAELEELLPHKWKRK
ncbi:MAG: IS66 family transposase [Chitinophagaceae bacterium]|nr:IS66 family transposase [Chitinophagaceae bacterium]